MPAWDQWLGDIERFERQWAAQRDAVADFQQHWADRSVRPSPQQQEYLAAAGHLARGWELLAADAKALAGRPANPAPPQSAAWQRYLRSCAKTARWKQSHLEVVQPGPFFRLARRHGTKLGIAALAISLAAAACLFYWVGLPLIHPAKAAAKLNWPCDIIGNDLVSHALGLPATLSDGPTTPAQTTCVYEWQEPDGKTGRLDLAIILNPPAQAPTGCTRVPGLRVTASHCPGPYPGGTLQFTLGGYQWSCWEESDRSQATAYHDEKALIPVLAASWAASNPTFPTI